MNYNLDPFTLEDLLADTDLAPTPPLPEAGRSWRTDPVDEDPDEILRTQLRAKALSSGRIRRWTQMKGRDLWRVWVARFDGDEDLALDTAILAAERRVRDRCRA